VHREQLNDLLADAGHISAETKEYLGGNALPLAHDAEQDVPM
jgi:hypothetical protein